LDGLWGIKDWRLKIEISRQFEMRGNEEFQYGGITLEKFWRATGMILILIGGMLFLSCSKKQEGPIETATAKAVEVVRVSRGEIRSELQLSGTIEASSQVMVFPKVAEKIIQMNVDEGSRVKKGDALAVIERKELELQLDQARAAYQAAQTAYEQTKQLAEVRVKTQISQARAQLQSAQVALQQVQALAKIRTTSQIAQAEAGLAALEANLEKLKRGAREEDRRQAEAAVNQAKANLANAESNYERMKNLYDSGAISKQSYEAAQTQQDVVKAQYAIALEQKELIDKGAREEDIRAMEAQVRQAEAALKLAQAQAETVSWEKDEALARAQVESAMAALRSAEALDDAKSWEAEIISAETAMAQAKAALELAQKRLDDATIIAPISGVVSERYLDLGAMATPTSPLFEIVDMDAVKATVSVIESDLGKLKLNDRAWVAVDALSQPVEGKVSLISPTLDRSSRSAKVEITVDNRDLKLKPGMFAKVSVPIDIRESALLIPRAAVIEDSEKNTRTVFVVEDNRGKRRQVEFGLTQGNIIEVSSGLVEGDAVVVAGQHTLKDGEEVTMVNP
jgi:HlyD family secretion protein